LTLKAATIFGGSPWPERQEWKVCYLPKCWPPERLKPVKEFPPVLFLVVSHEMVALLQFLVVLRDCTLATLGP
jgi:hypothetical protein